MTNFKKALLVLSVSLPVLAISLPSQATMTPYMENALIDVCKAAKSNTPPFPPFQVGCLQFYLAFRGTQFSSGFE